MPIFDLNVTLGRTASPAGASFETPEQLLAEMQRLRIDEALVCHAIALEADVEYLVVEGAMHYYRMTGDDRWLASVLPRLEKGIEYQTSDPKRWDAAARLCIRPYTIDTWDFTTEAPAWRTSSTTKTGSWTVE